MNSPRKTRLRRERLRREIAELETRIAGDVDRAKREAMGSLSPAGWVRRHPARTIAVTMAAGALIALWAGGRRSRRNLAQGPVGAGDAGNGARGGSAPSETPGQRAKDAGHGVWHAIGGELRRILMRKGIHVAGAFLERKVHELLKQSEASTATPSKPAGTPVSAERTGN